MAEYEARFYELSRHALLLIPIEERGMYICEGVGILYLLLCVLVFT